MAKTAAKNNSSTTRAARAPRAPRKTAAPKSIQINAAEVVETEDIDQLLADLTGTDVTPVGAAPGEVIEADLSTGSDTGEVIETDPADAAPVVSTAVALVVADTPAADAAPAAGAHIDLGSDIDGLLAELTGAAPAASAARIEVTLTDEEADRALNRVESMQAAVDAATPAADDGAAVPTGDKSDVAPLAADAATDPAAPKRTPTPRKHYSDKAERIKDRLGAGAAEYTVLTLADADVSDEKLKQVMDDTFSIIKGMNKKEQNRASLLFDFLTGKKASLNRVLEIALQVLNRDGHLTMGKSSNLITELLAKPYSIASARAMSGNTVGMYEDLMLVKKDGPGRFIANPESTLLAAANAKLGLTATA